MWPEDGVWICRRGLSLRAAVNLQLARPSFVLQESFHRRLAIVRQPSIGLLASPRPIGTDHRACLRDSRFQRACCEALCTRLYWKCVETRCVNCWPGGPCWSPDKKTRRGRLLRRCDCAAPSPEVMKSTADAAACHGVLWGGRTGCCSIVERRCCLVGVRAYVSL